MTIFLSKYVDDVYYVKCFNQWHEDLFKDTNHVRAAGMSNWGNEFTKVSSISEILELQTEKKN